MSRKSGTRRLPRLIGRICAVWACSFSCLSAQTFRLKQGAGISFLDPPGTIPAELPQPEALEGQFTLVHEDANPFPDGEYFRVIAFFLRAKESGRVFTLKQVAAPDPVLVATGSPGSFLVNHSPDTAVPSVVLSGSLVSPEAGYEGFTIQHSGPLNENDGTWVQDLLNDGTWVSDPLTPNSLHFTQIALYEYHLICSTPGEPDTCLELQPFAVLTFEADLVGEELLPGEAGPVKYPIGAPLLEGEGERSPLSLYTEEFVTPRAFPAGSIDFDARLGAFLDFENRRGSPHISVGYSDTPLSPGTTTTGTCAWYSVGPTNINGRVTSIAIDPSDNQRIFVTTVGGIWRSKTGGRQWERVSDDFLSTVFASVAINPVVPTEVFAGAGDPNYHKSVPVYVGGSGIGIWRSTSGGDRGSWQQVSTSELDNQVIARLWIDPVSPYNVYAATSKGVYLGARTTAGSAPSFARVGDFDGNTTDIAVDFESTPRIIYAGVAPASSCFPSTTARGIWKWSGSRPKWSKKDDGIPTLSSGIISLSSLSKTNRLVIYAKVSGEVKSSTLLQGIYKTENGGEGKNAWKDLSASATAPRTCPASATDPTCPASATDPTEYAWYNNFIEVDPNTPSTVYTGSINLWRSTDGGNKWSPISAGADTGFPFKLHEDQHAVAFDAAGNLYVANDGGLARTNNYKSMSSTLWHWDDISHGMVVTEFYRMTRQQATATLIAGGSQDNGTEISFGNQTWYNPYKCDGFSVAVDAKNGDRLYATCNCVPLAIAHPIPYSTGVVDIPAVQFDFTGCPVSNLDFTDPIVADSWKGGAALSMASNSSKQPFLLSTTDGKNWCTVPDGATPLAFPIGENGVSCVKKSSTTVGAIAIAPVDPAINPSLAFQVYYIGLINSSVRPAIWGTIDGGVHWTKTEIMASTGSPLNCPSISPCLTPGPPRVNAIAVDWADHTRAYAGLGGCGGAWGGVYMTTDAGVSWTPLPGSTPGVLPIAPITGVAVDPRNDLIVIYASSTVGVFKGTITLGTPPTATWEPFDQGLPNGLDVSDIWVNKVTKILSIGTIGHGAYERHIDPAFTCPGAMLLVRDNVFDRATTPPDPTPSGQPDPEHPIPDGAFYKPDDTEAGKVYWWSSTDIRIDVPLVDPEKNKISNIALAKVEDRPDHVEFETCPLELAYGYCPPGTLWDSSPQSGVPARFYVQVINRGFMPASDVKVIALWTDATLNLPLLPVDFWVKTFPAGIGLTAWSGWKLPDPSVVIKKIDVVNPEHPEVVSFDWPYPDPVGKPCMMVMVESVSDPIPGAARNELDPSVLAPNYRQIAVRNLHVIDVPPPPPVGGASLPYPDMELTQLVTPNGGPAPMDIVISKASMPTGGKVALLLPDGGLGVMGDVKSEPLNPLVDLTSDQLTAATGLGLDTANIYTLEEGTAGTIEGVSAPAKVLILYDPGEGTPGRSSRFAFLAKDQGGQIAAGSTYILRYRSPCDTHCLGLQVSGPPGNCPGDYTVRASAGDDSGDVIAYTFIANSTSIANPIKQGPLLQPFATFPLGAGDWTLSVEVSDLKDSTCPKADTDGICSETIQVGSTDPLPPTGVEAAGATREVEVSWSAPACGAVPTGYRVLRSEAGAPYTLAKVASGSDRAITDSGLQDDTEYCYVVETTNSVLGSSVDSDQACARTFGLMPPTNVTAARECQQVTVSWSPPTIGTEPDGYRIFRSAMDGSYSLVYDATKMETSYTDVGLTADTEYCYVVRTKSGGKTSVNSEEACSKTTPVGLPFRRGDVDGTGVVELTDVINLLGFLFQGNPKNLDCFDAADFDDTGIVELTDAIFGLDWLFLGIIKDLPEPGPFACGSDPSCDDLAPCNRACQ